MYKLNIRLINKDDYDKVRELVKDCFWDLYRPGALEHLLLAALRKQDKYIPSLEFVLEKDNEIVGQNIFYPGYIETNRGNIEVLTMGPVCISKKEQKRGYGKYLIDNTIPFAKALGYKAIFIEGEYEFYKKCGFEYAHNYKIKYKNIPEGMEDTFFLVYELEPGFLKDLEGLYESPYSDIDI